MSSPSASTNENKVDLLTQIKELDAQIEEVDAYINEQEILSEHIRSQGIDACRIRASAERENLKTQRDQLLISALVPSSAERKKQKNKKKTKLPDLYAVRGGKGHGIYEYWWDALDAGWKDRQIYGNACKFPGELRHLAEAWLERPALPNGRADQASQWFSNKNKFVKLVFGFTAVTLLCLFIYKSMMISYTYFDCDTYTSTSVCAGILKIRVSVSKHMPKIINAVFTQLLLGLGTIIVSCIGLL